MTARCNATIDLRFPIRSMRTRAGFQPHWRTIYVYRCPACGQETHVYAASFRGKTPEPSIGAIVCGRAIGQIDEAAQ